ncbi:MAG: restriction endonuclease [Aliishimia sp.]
MPIPDYQTLMRPVLQAFANGSTRIQDVLPALVEAHDLTPDEVAERIPSGTMTLLANRAHWARTYMSKAGLLSSPKRGTHLITQKGRLFLERFPDRIDNNVLAESSSFEEWRAGSDPQAKPKTDDAKSRPAALIETPEDRLSSAFDEIQSALVAEVLEAVLTLTPARFERLVVDLLLAMGYGGGDLARGQQTRLSSDGGIDGIVNEDELGLDAVYIQAKRYDPSNKVGRPALNAFVGSLTGEGATKGVFVTTSDFSREAIQYVAKVQHRIVLINGDRLARLMIKHEVGVRARRSLVIRSVDEDYFSDV